MFCQRKSITDTVFAFFDGPQILQWIKISKNFSMSKMVRLGWKSL